MSKTRQHKLRMLQQAKAKEDRHWLKKEIARVENKLKGLEDKPKGLFDIMAIRGLQTDLLEEKRRLSEL